ncbi:hypothetical protein [Streptomyces niveiscabiei]|uniref:Uncharacterized protein n=1 Tax=Streptomyces niveiscabiei TaxID=164115 RepID=A0ABW9HHJ1_9ACTN
MYSETDPQAANYNPAPGAYGYYTDPARGNVPQYRNAFDVTSWDTWLTLDALRQAPEITAPPIVVHSDGSALPDHAKRLYDSVRGRRNSCGPTAPTPAQMDNAVANVTRFFRTHLV